MAKSCRGLILRLYLETCQEGLRKTIKKSGYPVPGPEVLNLDFSNMKQDC